MNIVIDVDRLQAEGVLTAELAERLRASAVRGVATGALNALIGFGAFAVAAGVCLLAQSLELGAALGVLFYIVGAALRRRPGFEKLGLAGMTIGTLVTAGLAGLLLGHPLASALLAATLLFGAGLHARSALLLSLCPLALAAALGGATGYWSGCYMIAVQEPTITIVVFSALAALGLAVSKLLPHRDAPLALAFARMSLILVNFGFWIGSLWGDRPGRLWGWESAEIPALAFVALWLIGLAGVGARGAWAGRRFLVNIAVVFGAIEVYTQFWERWGDQPWALLAGGAMTVGVGLALWRLNGDRVG